jgi:uncharacterized membrane protein
MVMAAMYCITCTYPMEIRLILSNFVIRTGHMFFTIWFAEVACLTGGQMTVVAAPQVDADFAGLISILKRSIASRAWGKLIWLLFFIPKSLLLLSSDENTFRRKHFLFRKGALTKVESCMSGVWRKDWDEMERICREKALEKIARINE